MLAATTLTAHAQDRQQRPEQQVAKRVIGAFLSTGAYFFTNDRARAALGDVYFYNETFIYGRPREFGDWRLAGGLDIVNANNKFFPFSGGNQFLLIGPGFGIIKKKEVGKVRPFFGAGLYWAQLRSDRFGIDTSQITPGFAVGAEWNITRDIALSAGYRLQGEIGGIDTSGAMLLLKIF